MCSETLRAGRAWISAVSTMEIDAGASRAFSRLREAETTLCSRSMTAAWSSKSSAVPAGSTRTWGRLTVRKPMWVTRTSYMPGGRAVTE